MWGALTLALLASLWFLFAPAAVGGSTSYVETDGISMEPRFHSGDLAIVRQESDYRVGQIVAYHNRELGTVVLHRIIGRDGSRYTFKGDNNNFTDFEHPTRSQLIGALWIHLPGAGRALNSVRSPALIGLLFVIGTLLVGGVSFAKRRRRRKRGRAEGTRDAGRVDRAGGEARRVLGGPPGRRTGGGDGRVRARRDDAVLRPGRARLHPAGRRGERDQRPLPADREAQLLGKPARRAHLPVGDGAHRRTAVHARGLLRAARVRL